MTRRARRLVSIAICGLGIIAIPALAQRESDTTLKANPYRDVGGSCIYGRNGELVHAPKGVRCPTREEAPGARASGASDEFSGLPPTLRTEANALVRSHTHVADHLIELRRAIAAEDRTKALELTDEVAKELVDHLAREQAFFDMLEAEHRAH